MDESYSASRHYVAASPAKAEKLKLPSAVVAVQPYQGAASWLGLLRYWLGNSAASRIKTPLLPLRHVQLDARTAILPPRTGTTSIPLFTRTPAHPHLAAPPPPSPPLLSASLTNAAVHVYNY